MDRPDGRRKIAAVPEATAVTKAELGRRISFPTWGCGHPRPLTRVLEGAKREG